jgi:hypothetical protein
VNFLYSDLKTLKKGSTVVVTLNKRANVRLMDQTNYNKFKRGDRHTYHGGEARTSPMRIPVPRSGHWYLTIDLGGRSGQIRHSIRVEGPPPGPLPAYRNPPQPSLRENIGTREPTAPPTEDVLDGTTWDVFLSHASEDKITVAVPLSQALQRLGVTVWLDRAELRIGDSLRRRIDQGIASSRFAAVVLSESYMAKGWTQYELDGIVTLSVDGKQNLLPIWHGVSKEQVAAHSPSLADKLALSTADTTLDEIAEEIAGVVLGRE